MSTAHRVTMFVLFGMMLGCSAGTEKKSEGVTPEASHTKDGPASRYHHRFSPVVKMALDQAEVLELSSLEPDKRTETWKLLGKTQITDMDTRKRIVAALERGMENAQDGAKCFYPRHAVSASYGGNRVELVICFECGWISVSPPMDRMMIEFTSGEEQLLDDILKSAGVPLAKKSE